MRFFRKKCRKILVIQKNVVPLHPQLRNNMLEIAMILGYGVMVTLQILVLSFLVRVRVSQLRLLKIGLIEFIGIWCNGNTTDSGPVIPGSSPGIPTREHLSFRKMLFSYIYLSVIGGEHFFLLCFLKRKEGVSWTYGTPSYLISIKSFICSLHQWP